MDGDFISSRWRAVFLGVILMGPGACASSDDQQDAVLTSTPTNEGVAQAEVTEASKASPGLQENERQALLAIFANPEGAPTARPTRGGEASALASSQQLAEPAPRPVVAEDVKQVGTKSAYDMWFGQKGSSDAPDQRPSVKPVPVDPLAPPTMNEQPSVASPPAKIQNPIGVLGPQQLEGGTCGMFLWKPKSETELVFFGYGAAGAARMTIRGQTVEMERTSAGGMTLFGQFERQSFEAGSLRVDLTVNFARRMDLRDGAKVPQGQLLLVEKDGRSFEMTVAGIIGCQTAEEPAPSE